MTYEEMEKGFAEIRDNLLVQSRLLDRLDRKVEANTDAIEANTRAIAETNRAVAALVGVVGSHEERLDRLVERIDAFIRALGNGRKGSKS